MSRNFSYFFFSFIIFYEESVRVTGLSLLCLCEMMVISFDMQYLGVYAGMMTGEFCKSIVVIWLQSKGVSKGTE